MSYFPQKTINDSSELSSIEVNNRYLIDTGGATSVAWNLYALYSAGQPVVQWNNQGLFDSSNRESIAWNVRQLRDTGGAIAMDWGSPGILSLDASDSYVVGTLHLLGATINKVTTVAVDTAHTILATEYYVIAQPNSVPVTIIMPSTATIGQTFVIKDGFGGAGTNNITINGNGINIDGASTYVINQAWGSITLTCGNTGGGNKWLVS